MKRKAGLAALAAVSLAATGTARAQNNHDHWGQSWGGPGTGLQLNSTDNMGLYAVTQGNSMGVFGWANATAGNAWGVFGLSDSPDGAGVYGGNRATSGAATGVRGDASAAQGKGVYGVASAGKGQNYGVYGETRSRGGVGVYGTAPSPGYAGYFNGNTLVAAPGSLSFGSSTRQMLNLWGPLYGIGVQNAVLYFRADGSAALNGFAWYKGGGHSDNPYDAGGGTVMMKLEDSGLTVNGTFVSSSDAAVKQDIAPLDVQQVLEAVGRLPINEWSYRADPQVRHVGPMAQDFQSAFGLGADDRHIAMVDADGVALAAIQALKQLVSTQQAEIGELRARMAEQGSRIESLLARQAH